jgi:autotransporter-associated beta strand protein
VSVAPLEASLAIQGILSGGFTLTGGGVLQLNAPDLYSGETIITAGSTLLIGVANAGSRFSQLDLMSGTF